ncbi:hypothetical protein EGW08_016305, partial [Elysia chlorotica]
TDLEPGLVVVKADYYRGTDIQFTWDFGDRSAPVVTNSSTNQALLFTTPSLDEALAYANSSVDRKALFMHKYERVGEYTITVTAANHVSHSERSKTVFMMHHLGCEPPTLKIIAHKIKTKPLMDE